MDELLNQIPLVDATFAHATKEPLSPEEIEEIAHKIEDMFEGVDYEDMTLKQIRKHQEKVSKIMDEHEMAMKVKELELQELEDAMVHIDQDLVEEVETSAKQYERVLVDVAAKL